MKKILALCILTLTLVSCSKGGSGGSAGKGASSPKAEVEQAPDYVIDSTQSLTITQNNQNDLEIINFGNLMSSSSKVVRISIVNKSATQTRISLNNLKTAIESWDNLTTNPGSVSVILDKCSGRNLPFEYSCVMDVKLQYNPGLNDLNKTVILSGQVAETSPSIQLQANSVVDNVASGQEKLGMAYTELARVTGGFTYVRRIIFKNLSEKYDYTFGATELATIFTKEGVTIRTNTCDGKTVQQMQSCFIDIAYAPALTNQGVTFLVKIPSANVDKKIAFGVVEAGPELIGGIKNFSVQLGGYTPLILNYANLVQAANNNSSNVTYQLIEQNLGGGEYSCTSPTNCIYIPSQLGTFHFILKGTRSTGETANARVNITVFGSDNVPVFSQAGKISLQVRQGESVDFNLITASSGSDLIRYEVDQFPAVGELTQCLNLQFSANATNDLSCRYLANGNLFSTSFTYKAINTVNNKFSLKEVQISILDSDNILDVYPSKWGSLALNDAGFVFGRGLNESAAFGIDADYKLPTFIFEQNDAIKVPLPKKATQIWVKNNGAIAKLEDGTYYAWGQNRRSKLGIPQSSPVGEIIYKPREVTLLRNRNFIQITINENSSCGITSIGDVFCWGSNEFSELAANITTPSTGDASVLRRVNFGTKPAATTASPVIWDRNTSEYSILPNGSATRVASIVDPTIFLKSEQQRVDGDFEITYTANNTEILQGWFVGVSKTLTPEVGSEQAGFNFNNNTLRTFQYGDRTAPLTLLEGVNTFKLKRVGNNLLFLLNNVQVDSLNYTNTTEIYPVVRLNGKILTATSQSGPLMKTAGLLAESSDKANHHCAIVENEAYCWGLNSYGQLGIGRTDVQVPSSTVATKTLAGILKKVTVGASFTCGVTNADRVKCWGRNDIGQLGYGDTISGRGQTEASMSALGLVNLGTDTQSQPLRSRDVYIGAGGDSTCSILNDYRVKCWGKNDQGQLGDGTFQNKGSSPAHMGNALSYLKNGSNIDLVAAYLRTSGTDDFCLRSNIDTKVYCWGKNEYRAYSAMFPNSPSIPQEYSLTPSDTAPFLAANAIIAKSFTTNQNIAQNIGVISPTYFKDLYSTDDQVLYFFDESSVNIYTGFVYDRVNPNLIAGRLNLNCLNGISKTQLSNCQFTPTQDYTGTFDIKYRACSQNLKCSDQLITLNSRVTDPNLPYFASAITEQIINIKRFESNKAFTIAPPTDPQGRPSGMVTSSSSVRISPVGYHQLFNDEGDVVGIITGSCFALSSPDIVITQSNQSTYRQGNCVFTAKETFKGSASLKYKARNSAGFESPEYKVTFVVKDDYQDVLHVIGTSGSYLNWGKMVRFPEFYGPNAFGTYSSLYLAYGAGDNSTLSGPYYSAEMYPIPVYTRLVNDLRPNIPSEQNAFTEDILSDLRSIKGKDGDVCAIKGADKNLICWSKNYQNLNAGYLNNNSLPYIYGPIEERHSPRYIVKKDYSGILSDVRDYSPGERLSCAIVGPTQEVICWGKAVSGCGSSTTPGKPCGVIRQSDDSPLLNAKSISVGAGTACAVVAENSIDKLYCWGYRLDADGEGINMSRSYDINNLSHYDLKAKLIPGVPTPVKVAVAEGHACASSSNNKAYCWGLNHQGILGRGNTNNVGNFHDPAPVKVDATTDLVINPNLIAVGAGNYGQDMNCAMGASNLHCWGYTTHASIINRPVQGYNFAQSLPINEPSPVVDFQMYYSTKMCIRLQDNRVKCWGNNNVGTLGSENLGWIPYSSAGYLKDKPNGVDLTVKDFALVSDDSGFNNLYLINQTIIENHDFYQPNNFISQIPELGSSTVELIPGLAANDEIILMRKNQTGTLTSSADGRFVTYQNSINIGNGGNSYFDYILYYAKSDPSKVYKYYFETTAGNNTPVNTNLIKNAYVGSGNGAIGIYFYELGTDTDSSDYGFILDSAPQHGTFSSCQNVVIPGYNGNVVARYYCNYTPNSDVSIGSEETISYRLFDGNSYSPVNTFKIKILDGNKIATSSNLVEYNILSYYPTTIQGVLTESQVGAASGVSILSGVENDGGIYKIKDSISGNTLASIDAGCFLSGYVYTRNCVIKPISGIVGEASIVVRYTNGVRQSDPVEYRINIGQNLNKLLYAVGLTSIFSNSYQEYSYLFRLQGGTNPTITNSDAYPVPFVARNKFDFPTPQSIYYPAENRTFMDKISKISTLNANFCLAADSQAYCYGSMSDPALGGIHGGQASPSYNRIYFNDGTPVSDVKDIKIGTQQSCATYGADKKIACWGRNRHEQINQTTILRSGCGAADTFTRRGYACNIVKQDNSLLNNVESISVDNNTTCAIVKEGGKGQLYCWGFRFESDNNLDKVESNPDHNTNYASKVPGFENDDVTGLELQPNRACITLASGFATCIGQNSSYVGSKNRPNLHSKYLGRNLFIVDAMVSGDLIKKRIEDQHVFVEVAVPTAQASGVNLSSWSVDNEDDSSPEIAISSDRVDGSITYKSLKIKIKNKKDYEVSFDHNSLSLSGVVKMEAASSIISSQPNNLYCVKTESAKFYCWGYDNGRVLSNTPSGHFANSHFSSTDAVEIPWMSTLEPHKQVKLNPSSMCLINQDDEAKCWGQVAYGSDGDEALASSTARFTQYQNAPVYIDKINGSPIKVTDIYHTTNGALILTEDLLDINLDPQPVELSVTENSTLASLIPNIDTNLYEYFIISKPSSGRLSGDLENLQYTPNNNYSGRDQFTYRVYDKARGYSVVNTVILKVNDINNAPKVFSRNYAVLKNTAFSIYTEATDAETQPHLLGMTMVTPPQNGTATCANQYCTYTPANNYVGLDSFTYTVTDGVNTSALATVSLDVRETVTPYFANSLFSYVIPKNSRKYSVELPTAKAAGLNGNPYLNLELNSKVVKEYDNSISLKDDNGKVVAKVRNCFMASPSQTSSDFNCTLNLVSDFVGTLSIRYKAVNQAYPALPASSSDYIQVDFSVGTGGKSLYGIGLVSSTISTNPLGHFEPASIEYRVRGGDFYNQQVANLSSRELYPVPMMMDNEVYNDVSVLSSSVSGTGICWANNSADKAVLCLGDNAGPFGFSSFSPYGGAGPAQRISWVNGDVVSNVKKLVVGGIQSCAIEQDDTATCWGGTLPQSISPTTNDNSGCGFLSSVTPNGRACKLVDNSNQDITNIIDISVGSQAQGCLIKNENGVGKVYCWGIDFMNPAISNQTAKEMTDLNVASAVKVAVGEAFVCVSYDNNTVRCMGSNSYGRLGRNNTDGSVFAPALVNFTDGVNPIGIKPHSLQASLYRVCAIDSEDKLQCWGYAGYGEFSRVSDYPTASQILYTPRRVMTSKVVSKFALSPSALCIVDSLDEASCVGYNLYEQLGNGRYFYEGISSSSFNQPQYVSETEMRPIKEYLNRSNVKVENIVMRNNNTYFLVDAPNTFEVPLVDVQETEVAVNENTPFNVVFAPADDVYYIFKKPDSGTITGDSANNLVISIREGYTTSFIDYISYLVKDMMGNSTVKKYVFKVAIENDAPKYVDQSLIIKSGTTLNIYHTVLDPDSNVNNATFTITQGVTQGTLNCSGAYCSYVAPALAPGSADLVEIVNIRVTDQQGLSSVMDGVITITVKASSSPILESNFASFKMYEREISLGMVLPEAKDPRSLGIFYSQSGNTVRNEFDSVAGAQRARVFDKNNANLNAGYLSGTCALAVGGTVSTMQGCSFMLNPGYKGTVRFEYLASNGTDASSVVVVEIEVADYTNLYNFAMVMGNLDFNYSGLLHTAQNSQQATIDYFVQNYQSELNPNKTQIVNPSLIKDVEAIYANPRSSAICVKKKSEIDPSSSRVDCSNYGAADHFGRRLPGFNGPRFVALNNENARDVQADIIDLSIGTTQTCAIVAPYNEVKCWGETSDTTIGESNNKISGCGFLSSITTNNLPCNVVDTSNQAIDNVVDLGLGTVNKCLVRDNNGVGQVMCWGFRNYGNGASSMIANYDWTTEENFAKVVPGTASFDFRSVESGGSFACAETKSNSLVCWGQNKQGQLGRDTIDSTNIYVPYSFAPQEIQIMDGMTNVGVKPGSLQMHDQFACVIGNLDNQIYCWGTEIYSNLFEDNTYSAKKVPTKLTNFTASYSFKKIRLGLQTMCGILDNDEVVCWGYNPYRNISPIVGDTYIRRNQAQKIIDPITSQPMKVDDVILPHWNTIFLRKNN